ncbi:CDC27 family protein [Singulisphaera sp. Ch08]|uniref:CDC27 family protein n=1 Tax=Singulisphaera sp. Ch08 TaxID=3120278 RepID=A0AAU7CFS0_9BACT
MGTTWKLVLVFGLCLTWLEPTYGQRGGGAGRSGGGARAGGGGRPGGGAGGVRSGGGRPGGGMTSPVSRPSISRPGGGYAGAGSRPGAGASNRPAQRPSTTPGSTYRPGTGGITRPTPLPGGGNRPGAGGGGSYAPGIGNRPGLGDNRPGGGINRPGLGDYRPGGGINRPGLGDNRPGGGINRPGLGDYRPGGGINRPGLGDNRPGGGINRPGLGDNRPGGGINRPGLGDNRPGGGINRPGLGDNRPGGGINRPGLGDNRPGGGINRPGQGDYRPGGGINRPGVGVNRPGGGINRPGLGDNLGVVNRPNQRPGGGWFGNSNIVNNNINVNINNGWGGGGRWHGQGWGRPNSHFRGHWYRGSWGRNHFGRWVGPVGWGVGPWRRPIHVFPTWGHAGLVGWGLGPWANRWMYTGFTNPYFIAPVINTTVIANAQPVVVHDYSRPLDLTSVSSEPEDTEQDDSTFLAARDAFKTGDFARALSLTDLALKPYPNDPVLHEFRALCLFALGRYDEAAGVLYAVLTAGPGWDWATMIGLYPDVDTYTSHIRALEAAIRTNPNTASNRFVLAYQYMVQDHIEQARQQFQQVAKLQPKDGLAAQFAKLLAPDSEGTAVAASEPAQPTETEPMPSPPPAALVGTWKAKPSADVSIELTVQADGQFAWDVNADGQADSIIGEADYLDGVLTLSQADAPPLVGKVLNLDANQFGFELLGGPQAATIQFSR